MDRQKEKAVLEAILFTMGESVETDRLAAVIEEDKATTRQILMEMKDEYEEKEGGVTLMELEDSFQMCTRADMYEYLIRLPRRRENMFLPILCLKPFPLLHISSLSPERKSKKSGE